PALHRASAVPQTGDVPPPLVAPPPPPRPARPRHPLDAREPSVLDVAMVATRLTRPDALIVVPNPLTYGSRHSIASVGLLQQVPVLFGWREFMDADGLMAYGASLTGLYRRAGVF